jgi:acetylornithine deacetylase/succinyl-diaminopimelate desuccinylase-like protein
MSNTSPALQYAKENHDRFYKDLCDFIRIPSISTSPENKPDMQRAAEWLSQRLKAIGCKNIQIYPTAGHPVVFGEIISQEKQLPTVLIYGHYDVQPVEPLDLWKSGPFDPDIRGENLYSRGASDMKGQIMASIAAVESITKQKEMPVNIKFMIEGEEEIGSPNLAEFMRENRKMLSCDVVLNPDTGMIASDIPTIVYGLRGLAYFEVRTYGPDHDLHSGVFGGAVMNPANALCKLIANLHDKEGRVTLPGFYDKVLPISKDEHAEFARLPMDEEFFLKQTGAPTTWGEKGYTPAERVGGRPTLDVNGIQSGFTGKGSKTVIPSWAMAKISTRLVPNQDPEEVYKSLMKYLTENAPKDIKWEVIRMSGGPACITDRNSKAVQALRSALETVWGKTPVYKREGGSVPVVSDMLEILKVDSVLTGFGLSDDNIHAPNEKLHLPNWTKGIDALIYFFNNFSSAF